MPHTKLLHHSAVFLITRQLAVFCARCPTKMSVFLFITVYVRMRGKKYVNATSKNNNWCKRTEPCLIKVVHLPQAKLSFMWLHFRMRHFSFHFSFHLNVIVSITAKPTWKDFKIPNVIVIIDANFATCTPVNFWGYPRVESGNGNQLPNSGRGLWNILAESLKILPWTRSDDPFTHFLTLFNFISLCLAEVHIKYPFNQSDYRFMNTLCWVLK